MALSLTELQAITDDYVEKQATDIYTKSNVLLHKLLSKGKTIPGGQMIRVVLEYAHTAGGNYGAATELSTTKTNIYNAARFPWSAYYANIVIDLDDQQQNSGVAAIVNMVDGKMKNAQKKIRTDMGGDVYGARTENKMNGLADLFNTTTSTAYGTIQEDDMAPWAAKKITTVEAISFAVMQKIRRTASIDDNMEGKPDLYLATEALKDAFEASLTQNARFTNSKLAAAGFDNILFGGQPVVSDNKLSAGIVSLNTRFLDMLTHEDFNFTKPVWASEVNMPDKKVAFIRWSGNLVCKNRAAHCQHTGVTAE